MTCATVSIATIILASEIPMNDGILKDTASLLHGISSLVTTMAIAVEF